MHIEFMIVRDNELFTEDLLLPAVGCNVAKSAVDFIKPLRYSREPSKSGASDSQVVNLRRAPDDIFYNMRRLCGPDVTLLSGLSFPCET